MVGENQGNITIPNGIIKRLDRFLETTTANEMGLTSRPQVVLMLLRELLDKHVPVKVEESKDGEISYLTTKGNKIILLDSILGSAIVEINEKKELQCYLCKEDSHNNRYTEFVAKNKDLWPFLRKQGVKFVTVRDEGASQKIKI